MKTFHAEKGNALWFILIAIVLLGGLTILLSRTGSDVDQSGDVERLRIEVSQLLRHAKGMQTAVDTMIGRGISENDISFENTKTTADYTNAKCIASDCQVFGLGGGQTYMTPPSGMNDGSEWIFNGQNNIGTADGPVGTTAAGTGNDLIMILPKIRDNLCVQINRQLNVGTAGIIPEEGASTLAVDPFTGSYDNSLNIISGDSTDKELDRHEAGCFKEGGFNYFYYVLLAR